MTAQSSFQGWPKAIQRTAAPAPTRHSLKTAPEEFQAQLLPDHRGICTDIFVLPPMPPCHNRFLPHFPAAATAGHRRELLGGKRAEPRRRRRNRDSTDSPSTGFPQVTHRRPALILPLPIPSSSGFGFPPLSSRVPRWPWASQRVSEQCDSSLTTTPDSSTIPSDGSGQLGFRVSADTPGRLKSLAVRARDDDEASA